ncbi:glutamate-trna ligase [Dermatophagoides farinae]|uniref:Nondiscriminating glutamyl-tRNA synthetase EARS2, mitochondrial n=1 Tax=Dermatophagoides farinae TaxID=6954 RepID=A0A9D4NVB3_DERFA|nr:glutamate-trna ligase [Dermatophagoides farinae]
MFRKQTQLWLLRPKWMTILSIRSECSSTVRLRFAPSPTGFVHLGGLRTTLFNYLFARKHGGKFIVRIEDTDRERIVPGSLESIMDILRWSNLQPDEGPEFGGDYGPYIQSERVELYREMIEKLLKTDTVYRCFCTHKRLELLRREAVKNRETPRYDNRCRSLSNEEIRQNLAENIPYTVRLKLLPGPMDINDLVYGRVTYDLSLIEGDPILFKSDGLPTYHFANVVDDYHMQITHVLRGVEWLVSTPKHLMIYDAFGWPRPKYAHLPLLINTDGSKLSKRHDHIRISTYRDQGYYPEVVINYLTQMGGGFGQLNTADCDKIYPIDKLAAAFDLQSVNQNNCKIDVEKIRLLNRLHIRNLIENDPNRIRNDLIKLLERNREKFQSLQQFDNQDKNYFDKCLRWSSTRIYTINDLITNDFLFLWSQPKSTWVMEDNFSFGGTKQQIQQTLQATIDLLWQMNEQDFDDKDEILQKLRIFNNSDEQQMKFSAYMKLLRLSLTNLTKGPPVAESISLLGKNRTIQYITNSIEHLRKKTTTTTINDEWVNYFFFFEFLPLFLLNSH